LFCVVEIHNKGLLGKGKIGHFYLEVVRIMGSFHFLVHCCLSVERVGIELSPLPSVGLYVSLLDSPESVLWQNGWLDLDAVWSGKWGQSRMGVLDGGGDSWRGSGSFGSKCGHPIGTDGDGNAVFTNFFGEYLLFFHQRNHAIWHQAWACLSGLVGQTTNCGAHWPAWVQSPGKVGVHAIGLNSWTGTEGSAVSSLICDRWQRLNLESCLIAVWAASGKLMFQATRGAIVCTGWLACHRLAWRACRRSPVYRCTGSMTWHKRNEASIRLVALLNTVQGSQQHITHTHRLHRVVQWA